MSTCISHNGEFSAHVMATEGPADQRFVCTRCWAFDEDAALAYIDAKDAEVAVLRDTVARAERLVDEWETTADRLLYDAAATFRVAADDLRAALASPGPDPDQPR